MLSFLKCNNLGDGGFIEVQQTSNFSGPLCVEYSVARVILKQVDGCAFQRATGPVIAHVELGTG